MESEYDRKFEEMKKYIPFLESMIKRLESNSSSSNPRQAQLDKIRSLRDLLLDKKKRMKMENLLKCEQVLVNLYAKVEHTRDSIPLAKIEKSDPRATESLDLATVRNKLKNVMKSQNITETLPEIARASEREEICEPGSKEPALFQRRPNRSSLSPGNHSPGRPHESRMLSPKGQSKRYTRVLLSPERQPRWSPNKGPSAEKVLLSRRSPRRSPRRTSPSYNKKERKKSAKSKDRSSRENQQNLNITLKVPEESLHSLNTEDIISRIITCSDGDVDIATLRELRTQILGELQQTGKNDDISELILKSYNKKSKPKKTKKQEVEEGEISDSESEVIDSVYGSLVVMDKDKKLGQKTADKTNQQRKIQICLVLNSEKEGENELQSEMDLSETGVFQNKVNDVEDTDASPHKKKQDQESNTDIFTKDNKFYDIIDISEIKSTEPVTSAGENKIITEQSEKRDTASENIIKSVTPIKNKVSPIKTDITPSKIPYSPSQVLNDPSPVKIQIDSQPTQPKKNLANFYNSQPEDETQSDNSKDDKPSIECSKADAADTTAGENKSHETKTDDVEIPLLNEPHLPPQAKKDVLSEIDILQALKNEILSEAIPITPTEAETPALHQPKLAKVAPASETSATSLQPKAKNTEKSSVPITKKRISIENYKKKSETVAKSLFVKRRSYAEREAMKKQSLKLTEKECERFNFTKHALDDEDDDISDDDLLDEDRPLSLNDIYANLVPKSPEHDNFYDDVDVPVLIPTDPVQPPVVSSAVDVDMRSLPTPRTALPPAVAGSTINIADISKNTQVIESNNLFTEGNRKPPADPRLRRDLTSLENSNSYKSPSLEGTPRPLQFPNIIPHVGMTPVYTPSYAPSMTPIRTPNARSYEMTPTHQPFDVEEPKQKHVYAPSFPVCESRERDFPVPKERPVWEPNLNDDTRSRRDTRTPRWEPRDLATDSPVQRDPPSYNPRNDKYFIDRRESNSKQDCPPTPGPSFGWSDGSGTPGSSTGRLEAPMTPSHPFGRSECPPTPSHPFGRSECPPTPSHPFGRSDYKDPRLNRRPSEYESRSFYDDKERGYHNDRGYNRSNSYRSHNRPYGEDSPRNYDKEQPGRSDKYSNEHYRYSKSNIPNSRQFERERSIGKTDRSYELSERYDRTRREPSLNRSLRREDNSRLFTRDRDHYYNYKDQSEKSISRSMPEQNRLSRARSVGRTDYDNSLSVKPQEGHAFTIDTSVMATFQKFLDSGKGIQVFDYSVDPRRQRATSVGRSLVRESSVGRILTHEVKAARSTFMDRSKRASSVGRSVVNEKKVRTLTEIKDEFKSFKCDSYKISKSANNVINSYVTNKSDIIMKQTRETSSSSLKYDEYQDGKHNAKTQSQYSPRKNNRDPRMRKELKDARNRKDRDNSHSLDRRHSGIVYSNDNIAKGSIMGTGFGVKNYKIPKIKRSEPARPKTPIEEQAKESEKGKSADVSMDSVKKTKSMNKILTISDDEEEKEETESTMKKSTPKTNSEKKKTSEKTKQSKDLGYKKAISSDDDSDVRVTRSSKKIESSNSVEKKSLRKTKRIRKIIDDSDSEETETENKSKNTTLKNKGKQSNLSKVATKTKQKVLEEPTIGKDFEKTNVKSDVSSTEKELRKTLEDSLDSSFGIDDLGMFTDNIGPDPVIDSINDLIADLDKDLSAPNPANESFTTEMEKMMGAIEVHEENTLCDISELIEKDLNDSNNKLNETLNKKLPDFQGVKEIKDASSTVTKSTKKLQNNDDEPVSTTQIQSNAKENDLDKQVQDKNILVTLAKGHLAPDSTIVQCNDLPNKTEESLPDSTIEIHSEVSSDVTSTLNDTEKSIKRTEQSTPRKEVSAIESFGSLLSILQDKSKIKELLSMLGDKSVESEKIKKKLEKLSEIVSDDEDANTDEQKKDTDVRTSDEVTSNNQSQITENEKTAQNVAEIQTLDHVPSQDIEMPENEKDKKEIANDCKKPEEKSEKKVEDPVLEKENVNKEITTDTTTQNNDDDGDDNRLNDDWNDDHIDEHIENQDEETDEKIIKTTPKKNKGRGRGKGRTKKGKFAKKNTISKNKTNVKVQKIQPKVQKAKASRELKTLQNDIKEMFMCNDVLNATGIRMCRLAKMVDKKGEARTPHEDEPVVVLEKCKEIQSTEEPGKKLRKKPGPKPKPKPEVEPTVKKTVEKIDKPKSSKPGPKSKTKQKQEADPYEFDTDSMADTNTTKESDASSDSVSESSASSSSESSEVVADSNKKKQYKKRGNWKAGVIKPKHKKKKEQNTTTEITKRLIPLKTVTIPDLNCFTDKLYCFQRSVVSYDCRLCHYSGPEIVSHYKKQHAHTEVPLSRMDPDTAKRAIEQCEQVNFQAISKIPTDKYTCRFCYKEFSKAKVALENFFWHVVSTHTGEYKQLCYECLNVTRCPFNLDIPPPPKEIKGQLIGYICGKCNFTQISLENLKTHVIVRHNDEQTEVFTINLGVMSQKAMNSMLRKSLAEEFKEKPRSLRSSRSNISVAEGSDDRSEISGISGSDMTSEISSTVPKIEEPDQHMDVALAETKRKPKPGPLKSKLRFETDEQDQNIEASVKHETEFDNQNDTQNDTHMDDTFNETEPIDESHNETSELDQSLNSTVDTDPQNDTISKADKHSAAKATPDIFEQPHFKVYYKENGTKQYVCCVNGEQNHYKTALLISLKKHVQSKHSENWDGYCCVCKVIVTLQGVRSSFKDCLIHFLDKHMDDFPIMEKIVENTNEDSGSTLRASVDAPTSERTESPRPYIAVRPLSDLITKNVDPPVPEDAETPFPVIDNVVSLGDNRQTVELPQKSPVYPSTSAELVPKHITPFQYEEIQAVVMSKKHRIVLDAMMVKEVLIRVFKCAGRFCSFTSDSAEDALVHASAHKQLGGEGALDCAYCNFDAAGNAIDLVMHVFKEHGRCPFSCVLCFYRAAADQLVGAHFVKAHGTGRPVKVLRATSVMGPVAPDCTGMLSRETAVPYYICNHGEGICKFRTYTPGKYCEHMQQKHCTAESHPCNLCEVTTPTATELVKHLKEHGLKLYQCTWCVNGANTETEMLSHAAAMHPTKNPQAYLRIITNKEGSTDLRVLPLIYLNKLKVPIEDVTPSNVNENPTKEAERSIELENLISQTSQVKTVMNTSNPPESTPAETPEESEHPAEIIAEPGDITEVQTAEAIEHSILSSPQKEQPVNEPTPVVIKKEKETPNLNQRTEIVYCLDSDDEDTDPKPVEEPLKNAVIDLSDEEPADKPPKAAEHTVQPTIDKPKFKKVKLDQLHKCPKCSQVFRVLGTFKRHTTICCLELVTISCPHDPCPIVVTNITQLINHYNKDHNMSNVMKQYFCGICNSRWGTLTATKKHLKDSHNVTKYTIWSQKGEDGTCTFTIHKEDTPASREMPKRKTSAETPKKFGIQDIDKLPLNPILDSLVYCDICEFSTKVRLNMVRHLQLHAERQPVPQTAPVNPVPHLESNEMHFDKMVNLASSSAATRAEARAPAVAPEMATRYPKYVADRQRHTCGAKGCSYISVDEGMLRIHWDTLHSGAVDYHCVHCPPNQHLDTTKSLTANRIIAHLKMHDVNLYACSACSYYHHKKQIVEKHIVYVHKDKGQLQVIREEGMVTGPAPPTAGVGAVGTMDLKPWQCGLCSFKSMLRQSVAEHCSKQHQTKMQYKCSYCPFRTSGIENIAKHQLNAHPGRAEDVFYYYYREGTVPDEVDGTPRWQKQRQKSGIQDEVKTEQEVDATPVQTLPKTVPINLNLVKNEVDENVDNISVEELCRKFGQFCEPNGISYKCPLCKTVSEYTRDSMQSHLYEELKYRRWSCAMCTYKAYHRTGLNEHMASEHKRNFIEPTELPVNKTIERWVSELLNHQSTAIDKNKSNPLMADQNKVFKPKAADRSIAGSSLATELLKPVQVFSDSVLEQAFGVLGVPKDDSYCCPKCNVNIKDEDEMRNHLESELTKIRWCCTECTAKFSTFHEAQFHCKSHPGPLTRPKEAIRDPSMRSDWVTAVISSQKKSMKPDLAQTQPLQNIDSSDTTENSLLVVRYEEPVSAEELIRHAAQKAPPDETSRKRTAESDSDDSHDSMVIYEPENKKINDRNCPFCDFVSRSVQYKAGLKEHILRHYNLRVLTCAYCNFSSSRKMMREHLTKNHPGLAQNWKQNEIPNCLPSQYKLTSKKQEKTDDQPKKVCLNCEASVPIDELSTHRHGDKVTEYQEKGDLVVKCCICLALRPNLAAMQAHYDEFHADIAKPNYAYYKLQIDTREVQSCGICHRRFTFLRDLRIHHSTMHGSHNLSYTTVPYRPEEDDHESRKRKLKEVSTTTNRVAKKSTSKLPQNRAIAMKSTTKLPLLVDSDSESEAEYSYYGSKPRSFDKYENVKTMMPMYNTMVEIDIKKLSGLLKIDPKVVVKDINK